MKLFADSRYDDLRALLLHLVERVFVGELYDYRAHDEFHTAVQKRVWAHQTSALWRETNSVEELLDRERIRLIFKVNVSLRHGWRNWRDGQRDITLSKYPAQELIRVGRPPEHPRDWEARWLDAGGSHVEGRLIALRNDPVWLAISAFEYPFAPFDVHSSMSTRNLDRKTSLGLGLIDRDTRLLAVETPPLRPELFYFDALPAGAFATPYRSEAETNVLGAEDDLPDESDTPELADGLSGRPYEIVEEVAYFLKNCPNSLTATKASELLEQLTEAIGSLQLAASPWFMARAYRCTGEIFDRLEQTALAVEYYGYALQFDPRVGVQRRVRALSKKHPGSAG
jgi:hypothetical protein